MWHLGQTVKHITTDEPYLYLGIELFSDNSDKALKLVNSDGELIEVQAGKNLKNFTEFYDENGRILLGKHALPIFTGVLKYHPKMRPDSFEEN
jgi:hypothetical protein